MIAKLKKISTFILMPQYLSISFGVIFVLNILIGLSLNSSIQTKTEILKDKLELNNALSTLEKQWSKENQKKELEHLIKMLGIFDVAHSIKSQKNKQILELDLNASNANKIINLILNKKMQITKMSITKIDENSLKLSIEII